MWLSLPFISKYIYDELFRLGLYFDPKSERFIEKLAVVLRGYLKLSLPIMLYIFTAVPFTGEKDMRFISISLFMSGIILLQIRFALLPLGSKGNYIKYYFGYINTVLSFLFSLMLAGIISVLVLMTYSAITVPYVSNIGEIEWASISRILLYYIVYMFVLICFCEALLFKIAPPPFTYIAGND